MTQRNAAVIVISILALAAIVTIYYMTRSLANQPLTLLFYLIAAGIAAFAIKRFAPTAKKSRCPQCSRAVVIHDRVILPDSHNADGGEPFPALLERRYLCQKCNFRYFELVETPDTPESYWHYREDKTKPTMTLAEWQAIKEEAVQDIAKKNEAPSDPGKNWMF